MPPDPAEAEKLELMKMRTLERRAKMSELQRLRKAQVSAPTLSSHLSHHPALLILNVTEVRMAPPVATAGNSKCGHMESNKNLTSV